MDPIPDDIEERILSLCDYYDLEDKKDVEQELYKKVEERMIYRQESFYIAAHTAIDIMDRYFRITKGDDF